ncbi:hypothetical protein DQ392_28530 [Streptomyces reniochalinae]|uniref:AG2 protein n=1 Tax=Streptomyces reniochalinae TaxID=2250578 RepID=A0A367EAA6_9ACTN|nr:hypothetical protein DQ392_28530 [Streptomyces reniochalinae]
MGQLRDLRLGKLNTAITDWTETVERLRTLATGEGGKGGGAGGNGGGGSKGAGVTATGLSSAAAKATWAGKNATVTREFVTKTATQFSELVEEAEDVLGILKSARKAFKQHKEDLETVVTDVAKDNVYVHDNNAVKGSVPSGAAAGDADIKPPTQAELDAAEKRVKRVLWEAGESNRIAARELRAMAKRKHDFSGSAADSLKKADRRQGKADAQYWTKRLKDGDVKVWELDEKELKKFNETLRDQRDNPAFTENFATGMGAEGTLQFWRDLADPGHGDTPTGDRAKLLDHIQGNLSMTLANATRVDSPAMAKWENDIINAGTKQFGHEGIMAKPYGFQIMSSLMGKGKFDDGFLDKYGDAVYKFERSKPDAPSAWGLVGMGTDLDPGDKSTGADPMTGYLKALSHNPDAATSVFDDPDRADYFLKDQDHGGRVWFDEDRPDSTGPDDGVKLPSREALGDALFAAGSGMNPDDPAAEYVKHTTAHNDVFDKALDRLAGQKDEMPAELRDDMAKLIGNHGTDAHLTMGGSGEEQTLDRDDLLEVSKQVSRDPHSYQILNDGMNAAMVRDIHAEAESPEDSLDRSGRTVGFLEEARYQAIGDKKAADLKEAGWGPTGTGGYLVFAEAASFLPGGGHAANAAFGLSKMLVEDETARIEAGVSGDNKDVAELQQQRLQGLKDEWYRTNSDWARQHDGYSEDHGSWSKIDAAANDGKANAREDSGDQ